MNSFLFVPNKKVKQMPKKGDFRVFNNSSDFETIMMLNSLDCSSNSNYSVLFKIKEMFKRSIHVSPGLSYDKIKNP